jgi:hypothetical protein
MDARVTYLDVHNLPAKREEDDEDVRLKMW